MCGGGGGGWGGGLTVSICSIVQNGGIQLYMSTIQIVS